MTSRLFALCLLASLAACGKSEWPIKPQPSPPPVASTTASPPPSVFNDRLVVTLTADRPATVFVTTDGSDSRAQGPRRLSGPSPLSIELARSTVLTFHSVTPEGGVETPTIASYLRAGGPPGTISGVVVVGGLAVGKEVGLSADGTLRRLGRPDAPGELPFTLTGLESGPHRLVAISDRNDDGSFWPLVDYASDTLSVTLDLSDPFKASAEGVRLYLGASQEGLATIKGTITLPEPPFGQNLSISALGTDSFGGGMDPAALLSELRNGYQVFTNGTDKQYPYVITDLEPGQYVPVPVLMGFGAGGLAMNFLANPLRALTLKAGQTGIADFAFGSVALSGTVTLVPSTPPEGFVYGVVAAKQVSFTSGLQGVLMPTVFLADPTSAELRGNYAGQALRDNASFGLRVFTSLDGENPLTAALAWVVNPLAALPPHATVAVGTADVVQDLTLP